MKKLIGLFIFVMCSIYGNGQPVLPLREQSKWVDEILSERIDKLLPQLMKREGIDCWVLISREYNEDPVLKTLLPAEWLSARRRTMLLFYLNPQTGKIEKHAIARYAVGKSIPASWDMQQYPDQWVALVQLITSKKPKKIGINYSHDFAHADGITYTEYNLLNKYLPDSLQKRVVSAEPLAVAWLETRTERELEVYPTLIQLTHQIIQEGFSEKVITPGITTTDDLVWWFRQRIQDAGLDTWFHPSVSIQRSDSVSFDHLKAFSDRPREDIIRSGDLIHVDIGISYLRLQTDIQEHAYLLLPGEKQAPTSLQQAFSKANRLQDILTQQFQLQLSGNEILKRALAQATNEKIAATIYTHPIGFHGHAAGPTIGLWDQQKGVPGSGDFPLHENTAFSIELNAASYIPEWKKEIRIMLEQDGVFTNKGFRYINGRQTQLWLIPRQ
ncbi:MAG: M24 family metallopeptidase [Chitinophagia bacterium]|jgi:Xaa-Pro aminopeptidase